MEKILLFIILFMPNLDIWILFLFDGNKKFFILSNLHDDSLPLAGNRGGPKRRLTLQVLQLQLQIQLQI
jgi:hypothetical protein